MNVASPSAITRKVAGQFFTPEIVAKSLVEWVVRMPSDRLLDPSCGDGEILAHHHRGRGIELDPYSTWVARERLPLIPIDNIDFFTWAATTSERFECAAGNPPFIRYQNFKGLSKTAANSICRANGVTLSGLCSAWAPFLVATASLLHEGGRMAFVVPAEIGHAPYAVPLLDYLLANFSKVQVVAVKNKLFPRLSEDCWLLYCAGRHGKTDHIHFSHLDRFEGFSVPPDGEAHCWEDVKTKWRGRLRPLLLSREARAAYLAVAEDPRAYRFGEFAKIGIGYISGANDFFHLSPSQAAEHQIPAEFLAPTVRRGKFLTGDVIDDEKFAAWKAADEACTLLLIPPTKELPPAITRYLDSERGLEARRSYKCRIRPLWYSVPGVIRPDYFLQYMAGSEVRLARNDAAAACTNSIHAVQITDGQKAASALPQWTSALTKLSCELEGHPLGGGMLKLEPREASRLLFEPSCRPTELFREAIEVMRQWRHSDLRRPR
ncbi:SAM-dependent DNA methyltransferase [Rhizobium leguminosarum]|uniref:SAM-dependent DNA methyltransferase n=1 Tax=Rhizobium leguminosarum TaxID=384 RepID=UPI001C93D464|nr:SAM-dependent DNA methyltransferase [Rhizobium leguminosarum]MBY5370558.1 SAM-dependent DNA methyltransferase [Rhizobium leguminosarum]